MNISLLLPRRVLICALSILAGCSVGGNEGESDEPSPVPSADVYVALGPVAEARVEVRKLSGEIIGHGSTASFDRSRDTIAVGAEVRLREISDGRQVGKTSFQQLSFDGLADSDLVVVYASGGSDIDSNDDGVVADNLVAPVLKGEVRALVRVQDLKEVRVFVNALTTLAASATATPADSRELIVRANRLAAALLKPVDQGGDLSGDRAISFADLYRYDPTSHEFKEGQSSRPADSAIRTAETVGLLLPVSSVRSVAQQLQEGGSENTPERVAVRLFGDSNNDGLPNVFEDPVSHDADRDGLVDSRDSDMDNDGIANDLEYGLGTLPWNPDTDGDGTKDGDEDFDGDGLINRAEISPHATDPKLADTDNDGLTDKQEIDAGLDPKSAADGATADTDADGIVNLLEILNGLNPKDAADAGGDVDEDGLVNSAEINVHRTNPRVADTDGDGIPDGAEIDHGFNPLDAADGGEADKDRDGLTNAQEIRAGLNPNDPNDADIDLDSDRLSSREEILTYHTNPKATDTDSDGLGDGDEVLVHATNPLEPDTDSDGLHDGREVALGTNPKSADTDGDGVSDGSEANGFLLFDRTTRVFTDTLRADSDLDGLHDGIEKAVHDRFARYVSAENARALLMGALHPNNSAEKPALGGLRYIDSSMTDAVLEEDPDGDGKPTIEELYHRTNPNDPSSRFRYVYEADDRGTRKQKFIAMGAAGFVLVPGGWDVDGDGQIEPSFFIAQGEARASGIALSSTESIGKMQLATVVYNARTQRFVDRLCNNSAGGGGTDVDTTDDRGTCRGNRYSDNLIRQQQVVLYRAQFTESKLPYTDITWIEAQTVLSQSAVDRESRAGGPYLIKLPSENQWIQVSRTVLAHPANWVGGSVGQGQFCRGHSDASPNLVLATAINDPYEGTGNSGAQGAEQKRELMISNGIVARDFTMPLSYQTSVFDFAGNVSEWTDALIAAIDATSTTAGRAGGDRFAGGLADFEDYAGGNLGGATGDIATMPNWWKPAGTNGSVLSSQLGVGAYFDGSAQGDIDSDGRSNGALTSADLGYGSAGYRDGYAAVTRGGSFSLGLLSGPYAAALESAPGRRAATIGFRAVAAIE